MLDRRQLRGSRGWRDIGYGVLSVSFHTDTVIFTAHKDQQVLLNGIPLHPGNPHPLQAFSGSLEINGQTFELTVRAD